jgi:hypothetical protein
VEVVFATTTESDAQPVTFQWDWTNNGSLDSAPTSQMAVRRLYPANRRISARVVATDASGATSSAVVDFGTRDCTPGSSGAD